ncbi:MAG TPA: FAD-dependent oxidoreductase [Acidimicrobiia bacterium]|nr:FAD-dependent oxidoreductase [Acidimicrobiia bacterium]
METIDVAVIGAGQAGLATSYHLSRSGVDHLVLERDQIGHSWQQRWDSFTLVLPNWTLQLPGFEYSGDDPDGFLPRDEIVSHLRAYASSFASPVREGSGVTRIDRTASGWRLVGDGVEVDARAVVLAIGSFSRQRRPAGSDALPDDLLQVNSSQYSNPESLPPGPVLVVGSGQSGCQIADDLSRAGREVFLACGKAPWLPRRVADRDVLWWIVQSGFMDMPLSSLSDPHDRLGANPQLTGRDGGRDLHFRTLAADGVSLLGHFAGAENGQAFFAPDLADSVAFGDAAHDKLGALVRSTARELGTDVGDELSSPPPWTAESPDRLELDEFGAVVWATGFRPGYASLIDAAEAFDEWGFPIQDPHGRGPLPGLHFAGTHFLRTRKSALLMGVGDDASVVVNAITADLA